MKIRNEILKQLDELKKIRKKLHIIPEIGFDTFETMKVVEECIGRKADLVGHNCGVFYLPYGEKCIAFRCELDALEIHEDIHHDCISKNQNMHACGHDLHMAIMIMTYKYFIAHPPSCSLLFIFQNAEESGAGAKHILSLGIFEKYCVQELYALHNLPKMKKGIYCKEGLLMAQSSEMNIHVLGQGGHVGFQKQLIDPMKTATLFLKYLHDHQLKNEPNICHIGKIESGEIRNGIAQEANLYGTIRCFNENDMKKLQQQLQEKLLEFDDLFHTQSNIIFLNEYPALMNDVHLVSKIKQLSEDDFHEIKSLCLSEDFSYYQDVCKTCYFLCGNPCNYELHTSKFMAMEEDYLIAIELNVRIVENSM